MSRPPDSGRVDLNQVFLHIQRRMLSHLDVGGTLEHPGTCGSAGENRWIRLLESHLPERYRASSAFIVDSAGNRSRQIDIAIYDRFYSPLIFPFDSGLLVPAESVYAVLEVKQVLTRQHVRNAGLKIASVRRLNRTSVPVPFAGGSYPPKKPHRVLGGIVATRSAWVRDFEQNLNSSLAQLGPDEAMDLGCVVTQGAFESHPRARHFSRESESLIYFMIRLIERLRVLGNAPAVDLMSYGRTLESFRRRPAR
ncbi:MAG TPA: DUF6602 domain-containing protein [Bryobacteraceae bacterium]|nr:DUF6602 domain-containing protein [Bryobacteraceae bacterium]